MTRARRRVLVASSCERSQVVSCCHFIDRIETIRGPASDNGQGLSVVQSRRKSSTSVEDRWDVVLVETRASEVEDG